MPDNIPKMTPSEDDWRRAARICRDVAELPDRTSPEENADFMLVTGDELQSMLAAEFAAERERILTLLCDDDSIDAGCNAICNYNGTIAQDLAASYAGVVLSVFAAKLGEPAETKAAPTEQAPAHHSV